MSNITFSIFSSEQIHCLSTIDIKDKKDLFSSRMGDGDNIYCSICIDVEQCPGHIGHITLCRPIIHPLYIKELRKLLSCICKNCARLPSDKYSPRGKHTFDKLCSLYAKIGICNHCESRIETYTYIPNSNFKDKEDKLIKMEDIKILLSKMHEQDLNILSFNKTNHPKNFIVDTIIVPPNCVRTSIDIINHYYERLIVINNNKYNNKRNDPAMITEKLFKQYQDILGCSTTPSIDTISLKARISGKQGIFRKTILGKRVNYCGRAVIAPDPKCKIDEVIVPETFEHNLPFRAKPMLALLNRQPSLQRMSIMALKTKTMKNNMTIRFNPAICSAYNADFDGDEMNIFYPSSYETYAEAKELMSIQRCILSPQNGKPCIHPIQDSITGAYILSKYNPPISKTMYNQCLIIPRGISLGNASIPLDLTPPLGVPLGRQLLLLALPSEYHEQILNGRVLDKKEMLDIIKDITIKQGAQRACLFIEEIQDIINLWLSEYGLSIGYDDCNIDTKVPKEIDAYKRHIEQTKQTESQTIVSIHNMNNMIQQHVIETIPQNGSLNNMILSGAKGSKINMAQITTCVGQQFISSHRPKQRKGRSLPHWDRNDKSLISRGYCNNSYTQGLSPSEYFFHCQGAREGLINTGVNTSKSGYIQRKFSKSLEQITSQYDGTVRHYNQIIQFSYD